MQFDQVPSGSGHVYRVERRSGPVWYAKYRPPAAVGGRSRSASAPRGRGAVAPGPGSSTSVWRRRGWTTLTFTCAIASMPFAFVSGDNVACSTGAICAAATDAQAVIAAASESLSYAVEYLQRLTNDDYCEPGDDCSAPPDTGTETSVGGDGDFGPLPGNTATIRTPNQLPFRGTCRGTIVTRTARVTFRRSPRGTLSWGFLLTASARAGFGSPVMVAMPYAMVNGQPINPPYSPHIRDNTYNFHSSMRRYQLIGSPGVQTLHEGDGVTLAWSVVSAQAKGYNFIYCSVPPVGTA